MDFGVEDRKPSLSPVRRYGLGSGTRVISPLTRSRARS